jgi:hypothetical protein
MADKSFGTAQPERLAKSCAHVGNRSGKKKRKGRGFDERL